MRAECLAGPKVLAALRRLARVARRVGASARQPAEVFTAAAAAVVVVVMAGAVHADTD